MPTSAEAKLLARAVLADDFGAVAALIDELMATSGPDLERGREWVALYDRYADRFLQKFLDLAAHDYAVSQAAYQAYSQASIIMSQRRLYLADDLPPH